MSRAPSFCGVILSAGDSTRMGTDKALLPWPPLSPGQPVSGETFLSAAIRSLSPHTDLVIVVAGKNEPNLEPIVYASAAFLVRNPDPSRGQFSSLQVGLQEVLNRGRDAAIITLVDRPPLSDATVSVLHEAFDEAYSRGKWALIPQYAERHGHPILIGREMMTRFLQAPADGTARDVEHKYQDHIEYFPVEDPFVAANINTPEDYAALTASISR